MLVLFYLLFYFINKSPEESKTNNECILPSDTAASRLQRSVGLETIKNTQT